MDLFEYAPPLEKALDAASLRQQVISNNMAHANDPNYRGQTVAFEDTMKDALQKWYHGEGDEVQEGEAEANAMQPQVEASASAKVDMNTEMANLAKNQILYQALTGKISGYFSSLKYVIDNSGH